MGASIKVLEDNQGAKALTENPLSSARSKRIDVRFHCFVASRAQGVRVMVSDGAGSLFLVM